MNDFTTNLQSYFRKTVLAFFFLFSLSSIGFSQIEITQCPADMTVGPFEGECGFQLDYNALDWTATGTASIIEFSPGPNDDPLPPGENPILLTVTDAFDNSDNCTFYVTVLPHASEVICSPLDIIIEFEDDCKRIISHFDLLQGGPYGCEDFYDVQLIDDNGNELGNVVDTGFVDQFFQVKITNNVGSFCWGTVLILSEGLPSVIQCPVETDILCHLPPEALAVPTIDGCFEQDVYTHTFSDERINSYCDGDDIAFVIKRRWTTLLPSGQSLECTQNINGKRVDIADVVFPPNLDGVQQPALSCNDTFNIMVDAAPDKTGAPQINGFDPAGVACNITVSSTDSIEHICGNKFEIYRKWRVNDFCLDNFIEHTQTIIVEDNVGPEFTVPDTILFGSHPECDNSVLLPAINLIHECSGMSIKVETPWNVFNSDDVIAPVASDPGFHDAVYTATDGCGNVSQEKIVIHVSDDLLGECPERVQITSDYYLQNIKPALDSNDLSVFDVFGEAEYFINCEVESSQDISTTLNDCFDGVIFRLIEADYAGSSHACIQPIDVVHVSDFVVKFPPNLTIMCGDTMPDIGEPEIFYETCELIAVAYEDAVSTSSSGSCFRVKRQWTVVNWCVTGDELDQEVVEMSEEELAASGCLPFTANDPSCDFDGDGLCDSRTFRDSWRDCNLPGIDEAKIEIGPDTDPDKNPWDGYITYEQIIRATDDIDPIIVGGCQTTDVCAHVTDCTAGVTIPDPTIQDCAFAPHIETSIFINGAWNVGNGPYNLVLGEYDVEYIVTDNCDNQTTCQTTINVVDCTPPVMACETDLIVQLALPAPPTFEVMKELLASDLDAGSLDNCTGNIQFSFSQDANHNSIIFTCDDELGVINLELWATDGAGNQDKCDASIILEDNAFGDCAGAIPSLTGTIFTENGDGVADVSIVNSITSTVQTDSDGFFELENLDNVFPFQIVPERNNDHSNGVTTFDIVILTRHILGVEIMDSPYKLIAADANRSNTVTTFDAVEIRKLILGINSSFPSNTSWRFVDYNHVFTNPNNPFAQPLPDTFWVNDENTVNVDIIGIKTGDLNESVTPNVNSPIDDRSANEVDFLMIENKLVNPADEIEIPVFIKSNNKIGLQCALNFDTENLILQEVKRGILSEAHFGINDIEKGQLNISYNQQVSILSDEALPLFTLLFKVKNAGEIKNWIQLDENRLTAEAYSNELLIHPLDLFFENNIINDRTTLYPAFPNPFKTATTLPFYLTEKQTVNIQFFKPSGELIKEIEKPFPLGYSSVSVTAEELKNTGIVFYRFEAGADVFNGRLILID